ncbi:MAG TPA: protein-methionine-sulfoxide reductase heme-binding subunit MsrQ [Gammaproteobacteria bacterium]
MPLARLVYGALTNNLGVNPVEFMTRNTGDWAMYFLLFTLAITPLRKITQWTWLIKFRRMLGLFVFFYASLHFLTFIWFEHFFNISDIIQDIIKRPFITIGFISLLLLIPLAITSNLAMMRRLKQNWQKLHRLIYPISLLVMLHYFMMIRADYKEALIYLAVLLILLAYRLPFISQKRFFLRHVVK